ncbi:MAG: hypothetical protein E7165_02900 [Firmicutes bacterium]|nr:hypothetical protein [Bacillota bacterium]
MYEEREKFSLKEVILQIVLVVLFVFLLLWLFPTKNYVDKKLEGEVNSVNGQVFSQNVETMKDAAISYFTTSRLPKKIGDKVTLTLGDMLDKKLLIPFLDGNNKQCSLTESYVELTKMDDEYILKVNLNCSDKSDYILVHLGCYSYCESGLCEKQETTTEPETKPTVKPTVTKKYQYEYELVLDGKWGEWSNWSDWSEIKTEKTDYRNVKTKEESVVSGTETVKVGTETIVKEAKENKTSYCPAGYTLNGTKCSKKVTKTDTIAATATTNNSCPTGYTLNGDVCSKEVEYISSYKKGEYVKTVYNASYVPKDTKQYFYEEVGADYVFDCDNECAFRWIYTYEVYKSEAVYKTKIDTVEKDSTTKYSCPSGYTLSGTKCNKKVTTTDEINASTKVNYSCEAGDLVGKTCVTYKDKYETINIYKKVTYYSYQTREFISGERKTVWSNTQNDKDLIAKGYKLTGKSKEI